MQRITVMKAEHDGQARLLCGTALVMLLALGLAQGARAQSQDVVWDPNPAAGIQPESGPWNLNEDRWRRGGSQDDFDNGDNVEFRGPVALGSTATVTITDEVSPDAIRFTGNGFVVGAQSSTNDFINPSDGMRVDVSGGVSAEISADIRSDENGNVTVNRDSTSTGTLVLSGDGNDIRSDLDISRGTVSLTGRFDLDDFRNSGTFNNSGTISADNTPVGSTGNTNIVINRSGGLFNNLVNGIVITDAAENQGIFTNAGTITADTLENGGTFGNSGVINSDVRQTAGSFLHGSGGRINGDTAVRGGTFNATGGTFSGGILQTGGEVNIAAATDVDIEVRGGAANNTAALTGSVSIGTSARGNGTFNNQTGGSVSGPVTVSNGTLNASGGTFGGQITQSGGNVNINAATDVDIVMSGGTAINNSNVALTGSVDVNGGTFTNRAGAAVSGPVTVSGNGALNAEGGNFGANIANNGGTVTVSGDTTVAGRVFNRITGGDRGRLTVASGAALTGTVRNAADFFLNGTLRGRLINSGTTFLRGRVTGGIRNLEGGILVVPQSTGQTAAPGGPALANVVIDGEFVNGSGSVLTVEDGASFTSAELTNRAGGLIETEGTIRGPVLNFGRIEAEDARFNGDVRNTGTIIGRGSVSFNGGLTNNGLVDMSGNGRTSDVVTVGGNGLRGSGTLRFDLDLRTRDGKADRVVMGAGAALRGTVNLDFNAVGTIERQRRDIKLIDVDGALGSRNDYEIGVVDNLPDPGGKIIFGVFEGAGGDVYLGSALNPGIGGIAGNVVLTQSLIGSVINRPSSPFVTGRAYEDDKACGAGLWARATGGQATATGASRTGGRSFESKLDANYTGAQVGGDFACFEGYFGGWDLAFGGIGGINQGSVSQPVFAVNLGDPARPTGILTSNTNSDFLQYYGGVYMTASQGPLAVDLQYRLEKTDFDITNTPVEGSSGLGLTNADFSSRAQTLSGSLSYAFPVGETDFTIVPTAGFAITKTKTDEIRFDNGDVLKVDDFDNRTLFVGATAARTVLGKGGDSFFRQFVTVSYYKDFAGDLTSTFTYEDNGRQRTDFITHDNLGAYGEVSVGVNYVRLLNPGQAGRAKQLSAAVRADARFGDQLDSWGISGQVRLQF